MSKERYINLSDRQVKDTQNQSQDFLSIKTICRLLNNQDQKIAELEAKLAESIRENKRLLCEAEEFRSENNFRVNKLKQQLEEKDAEIEYFKDEKDGIEQANELLNKMFIEVKDELAEKEKEIEELKKCGDIDHFHSLLEEQKKEKVIFMNKCEELLQSQNQTAIAELEKVKEKAIKPKDYGWCDRYKDCWDIVMDIDQQIKSLKGEKNE